jgi:hypothetical protein
MDLPQKICDDFSSQCETKIQQENLDFMFTFGKFDQYEGLFDFIPKDELISAKFLGVAQDLYKFFKSKPKMLFQTSKFYLFCERNPFIDKTFSKLLYERHLNYIDREEADSLFIDLSNISADQRFSFLCQNNRFFLFMTF